MLAGRLGTEALAGIVAGRSGQGTGGTRHLMDPDVDIFGPVRGGLPGALRAGGDGAEQAGRDHRFPEVVDLAAVVQLAALEAGEDPDMVGVEGELPLGGEAREGRAGTRIDRQRV